MLQNVGDQIMMPQHCRFREATSSPEICSNVAQDVPKLTEYSGIEVLNIFFSLNHTY